jgi:glucokinase
MILAADVGATKTYLGLFDCADDKLHTISVENFPTQSYPTFEAMVLEFLGGRRDVETAAFGIPGPVLSGRVNATNVPWQLETSQLARRLGVPDVHLLNDVTATGYGVRVLEPSELMTLNQGNAGNTQTQALIAAGTGLGQCVLHWNGTEQEVFPCEAGHADFAPHNALLAELLAHLLQRYPYVCVERVLSGPGLVSIYEFLRDTGRGAELPAIADAMREGDPASAIASAAERGECELCFHALNLFVIAYGAEAGNLALRAMALGGVYVGGGIAPKICKVIAGGEFLRAFLEKERMESLMPQIPLRVILNDRTGLMGAACYAATIRRAPGAFAEDQLPRKSRDSERATVGDVSLRLQNL